MQSQASPQSLGEALLSALGDTDRSRREQAIAQAAVAADPDSLVELLGKHEDAVSRNAALEALGRGGSRSLPALVRALRGSDEEVVMFAAMALAQTRDSGGIPHLLRLLHHPDLNVAQAAIDALGKLRAVSATGPIEKMLTADPWLRFAAANALGEIASPGSVPALLRVVHDPSLSDLAIEALGKIGSADAGVALAEIAIERVETEQFTVCVLALGRALAQQLDRSALAANPVWTRLASPEAAAVHERLRRILGTGDAEVGGSELLEVKEAAINVIRGVPLTSLLSLLLESAWDASLTEPLLDALVFAGPGVRPCVLAGLDHGDTRVRRLACEAAGHLNMKEAAPALCRLADDGAPEVRADALRALARLQDPDALPIILGRLSDVSGEVRIAAQWALGFMDAEEVTAAILEDSEFARRHAAEILAVMQAHPVAAQSGFIAASLADPREEVRRAAITPWAQGEGPRSSRYWSRFCTIPRQWFGRKRCEAWVASDRGARRLCCCSSTNAIQSRAVTPCWPLERLATAWRRKSWQGCCPRSSCPSAWASSMSWGRWRPRVRSPSWSGCCAIPSPRFASGLCAPWGDSQPRVRRPAWRWPRATPMRACASPAWRPCLRQRPVRQWCKPSSVCAWTPRPPLQRWPGFGWRRRRSIRQARAASRA